MRIVRSFWSRNQAAPRSPPNNGPLPMSEESSSNSSSSFRRSNTAEGSPEYTMDPDACESAKGFDPRSPAGMKLRCGVLRAAVDEGPCDRDRESQDDSPDSSDSLFSSTHSKDRALGAPTRALGTASVSLELTVTESSSRSIEGEPSEKESSLSFRALYSSRLARDDVSDRLGPS